MAIRFGEFTLEQESRQLFRGDDEVHLSPKAFELLLTLVRARPRALPKAELHSRLWPDTYVSDASLAMLVAEVRDALGDAAKTPRFVRTVHRYGYAFHGDATDAEQPRPRDPPGGDSYWLVTSTAQMALAAGENIVGRDPHATIWLDSPGVSRRHARVVVGDDRVTVEDLGSKNGTHVRGEAVRGPVTLRDGDAVRFGTVTVTFRRWNGGATTATAPRSVQIG